MFNCPFAPKPSTPNSPLQTETLRWTRLAPAKWEDSWAERLAFLGPGRVAFTTWPGGRSVRMEAFVDPATAAALVRQFGGKTSRAKLWTGDPPPTRPPLKIRDRLVILNDEATFRDFARPPTTTTSKVPIPILIPAGMAFGTGDHATTAACLRMLCDAAAQIPSGWAAIDAGTGSGILAIAARALGAVSVHGFDFDPDAVRTAKANVRANHLTRIRITRTDVTAWTPAAPANIVLANLFSDLLIRVLPKLRQAVCPNGHLILSGILRSQLPEVLNALTANNFSIHRSVTRGKWSAIHALTAAQTHEAKRK